MKWKKGFTLIELMIVIAIIGILTSIGIVSFSSARAKANDAKRKEDLRQIQLALESYANDNGRYPQAGSCAYGSNCYVYSTAGSGWIPALVPKYMSALPVDPRNNADQPWTDGNYSYSYGNVSADGQTYDLTTQLENTEDKARCGLMNYKFYWLNYPWCKAFGGQYSNQIYERSP